MSVTILAPRQWSKQDRLTADEAPKRPWNRPAGGWITDEVELKKCVILCEFCAHKFNPKRHHYERWRMQYANATCDDCKRPSSRCVGFIHESTHDEVGDPMLTPRPRGRWSGWWRRSL